MPSGKPRSCSGARHKPRPPIRGSRKRLKAKAATAMSAACGQVRKRSRNAKPPTATWTSLRLASPPVRVISHHSGLPQPRHRPPQPFLERRPLIAQLALRLGAAVRPMLAEDVHHLVGEL